VCVGAANNLSSTRDGERQEGERYGARRGAGRLGRGVRHKKDGYIIVGLYFLSARQRKA
jgi:hypothetical protein